MEGEKKFSLFSRFSSLPSLIFLRHIESKREKEGGREDEE